MPPCRSILLSKILPYLASSPSKSTATLFVMPIPPSTGWTDLGNNRFLRHIGQFQRPTSWMVCPTPENKLTLKRTPGSTNASRCNSITTGSRNPLSNDKISSPYESINPLSPRKPYPLTPEPATLPTWSQLASTSASGTATTRSAPATSGRSNSGPSWTSYSLSGTFSSTGTPPPSRSAMPHKLYSPSTTRRIPSGVRLSPTSVLSPSQPAQSRQASTSSSACETRDVIHLPPIMASTPSAHPTSLPSSGPSGCKWEQPNLDLPQKMLEHTLSALADTWPCTSPMSQTGHS